MIASPGLSQLVSATQAAAGDLQGASETQDAFSKRCPVISQMRSAVEAGVYKDREAASRTQVRQCSNP
jgi:hypothetical protein